MPKRKYNLLRSAILFYLFLSFSLAGNMGLGIFGSTSAEAASSIKAPVIYAAIGGRRNVILVWSPVARAKGYKIYYGTSPGVYGAPMTVSNILPGYILSGLNSQTTYYLAVTAINAKEESPKSKEKSVSTLPAAPSAVVLNTAVGGNNEVTLNWTAGAGALKYKIYFRSSAENFGRIVYTNNVTTYTVKSLKSATTYSFKVSALNLGGESPKSNEKTATTFSDGPSAPVLNTAVGENRQVTLSWSAVLGASAYKIYYGTSSGAYTAPMDVGNTTQYSVSGLNNATQYYFVVTAVNANIESPKSNEKTATTIAVAPTVSITLDAPSIARGQSATLSWQSSDADTCTITPVIGSVALNGTMSVSPETTTTYTILATGPGGMSTNNVTLTVLEINSTVTLSANPETILKGTSTSLTWTSSNATSLYIDNGIGLVANSGTKTVSPNVTTTYTITATGALGSANAKVTVFVTPVVAPTAQPDGTFGAQYAAIVPSDATVTQYDIKRFAVIRGEVKDKNNAPLSQVAVVVDGRPQYGTTKTDSNGQFSLPVDINGTVNIVFTKEGFITTHRQVTVAPNDVAIVETLVMLAQDLKATEVAFNGDANNIIVHQSTPVSDVSGTRQANVIISGDNKAYAVDKNGNDIFELPKLNLRATEFTTPESMPAVLPPTTAFTYCVELKADGVERVRFKDPVVVYVDNFLGFKVGEIVPVGYYDRDRGVWVASENGRVVKLLDINSDGKVDALDSNNDGAPDDLNANGSYLDEVKGLNDPAKYTPGKTFWRVSLTHFTPYDLNWPMGPSAGAIASNATGTPVADQQLKGCEDDAKPTDSYVSCRSRIYHEDIDIPGTDLTLHYASNRVRDYKTIITVPASGATVPVDLKGIVVRLNIAGRTFEKPLPVLPNQTAEFSWDGLDFLGQTVDSATADIAIEFVYDAMYRGFGGSFASPAFGQPGVTPTLVAARSEFIFSKAHSILIHNQAQTRDGLADGWTLSNHHFMSAKDVTTLYKGNGDVVTNSGLSIISTVANVSSPYFVEVDENGNIYLLDTHSRIYKIDSTGVATIVAGKGLYSSPNSIVGHGGYDGDGGPATAAMLNYPDGAAFDSNGNIYLADMCNHRIRKIDSNGIITTIAGQGLPPGSNNRCKGGGDGGDGGLATMARLNYPVSVTVDRNGNIYIADRGNHRIRKIDSNGIITTIAGNGSYRAGYSGDGGPATAADLNYPSDVAVDQNGNIYIADEGNRRIRKIDPNGIITTVAGTGVSGYTADDGPATAAKLSSPSSVSVDSNGNIYIADSWNHRIRKIDISGIIRTIAGTGVAGYSGDGGPARQAMLNWPNDLAIDSNANIYVADTNNNRIRKISPATAWASAGIGDMTFVEEGLGYVFSIDGKHKQTVDLDTQKVIEQFAYDPSGRLISATDLFNNQIVIQRNAAGVPTTIISPDGLRTNLTVDANNHLTKITYPDGKHYDFTYTPGGLLTKETEPKGNFFTHTFDANGRITDVVDQEGGREKFARQVANDSGDVTTTVTSAEGDIVTYLDQTPLSGALTSKISVSGVINPTISVRSADDLTSKLTSPDLTVSDLSFGLDPEYKFKYLQSQKITTPSGLNAQVVFNRTYTDTNSDGKKDLIARTASVNNKITTLTHNVLTSTFIATSPLNRTVTAFYNPITLLTSKVSVPGLLDTTYAYDFKGRVSVVSTGTRNTSFAYDLDGNVQSVTDPRGNRTSYIYDAVGRTKVIHRPDATDIHFDYDANGNMTLLKNPSNQNHGYIYNNVNLATNYNPPLSPTTQYVYDKERRLKEINFPSGKQIKNIYTGVLLTQMQTPQGNVDYAYLPSGQLASVTKNAESLVNTYDGSLVKTSTLAGTLAQTLSFSYNNDLKISGLTYAGSINNFGYDNDGLLTLSGRFTISRNAQNGLPTSVTGGVLNLSRTFDGYAQLTDQTQTVNAAAASSWTLTYNNNGQIATKSETVAGITSTYVYTYDSLGRLTKVEKDGSVVEEYQYSASGTRSYEINSLRGIVGRALTYNAEDQLVSVGNITYQYDADGFLVRKVDAGLTTTYDYSSRGELLKVSLPSAQIVEYVYDPLGRRIAKKINSVIVEKYLWAGLTQLLAVYDGANNLLMRFEYSDARMPNVMTKAGVTYYLSYDQVGSLRAVYDATGALVKRIDYDSFGNILVDTNPAFTIPFGFAGGLDDRDIGLVHFGFRDYDPATGRWTAKDPIGFAGGDIDLYGYVESDPVNFVDFTGELKIPFTDINIDAGEGYGQDALNYWANMGAQTNNPFAGGFYNVMGGLAALWTPCTSDATAGVLSIGLGAGRYLGRPYYQYYPSGNPGYSSPYLTRGWGWKAPYQVGKEAVDKLSLPSYNPGTAVRQIKVNPFQYLKGPGRVAPANGGNGGGIEYLIK